MAITGKSRRQIIEMVVVSLGFAVGAVLIAWGLLGSVTGDDALGIPTQIETISPTPNEVQVLAHSEVFVDLTTGFEAELVIDGVTLETVRLGEIVVEPGAQIELPPTAVYDPGNFSIRFVPQEGAAIEEWTRGVHNATVIFWDAEKGKETAASFSWSFEVL